MKQDKQKAEAAYEKSSMWLANGNEAEERGDKEAAEKCFNHSQFWLDRANKYAGIIA